jgi:hypothetical protein
MIVELFHGLRWVDTMLHRKLSGAYNALLGNGRGPGMILTAETRPTRIHGAGDGLAWLVGFVLWPSV